MVIYRVIFFFIKDPNPLALFYNLGSFQPCYNCLNMSSYVEVMPLAS
jgi:hypothetical protein